MRPLGGAYHRLAFAGPLPPAPFARAERPVPMVSPLTLGVLLQLGAFFCFATMDTSAKWLVGAAIPALQVAFLRYAVHFGWALALYLPGHGTTLFRSGTPRLQALRGLLLLGGTVFNFMALAHLPLTTTISIFFAAPLVVCLLSVPVLGERVGRRRFAAVLAGFVGVLVIVRPWSATFDPHIALSLCAMLCASGYFVMTRRIAGIDSNAVAQSYVAGIATVALLPVVIASWTWPATGTDWGLLLLLGSLGMLGHSLLTRAHEFAEASVLAPMVYSQIVYVSAFDWLFFDSVPEPTTLFGTAIIIASGLYVWLRERRLGHVAEVAPRVGGGR